MQETKLIRLTSLATSAGCGAKCGPGDLVDLLGLFPKITDPNVLVGIETGDDAAVYRLNDDTALVLTTDFFPPVVDDPYTYGAISAANAMSDVWAMGGEPIAALNIVAFPKDLSKDILKEILRGGAEKAAEAGVPVLGGHTIYDEEPKYGMSVTGVVKPGKEMTNRGAKAGDVLVLTKPIGAGVITTAARAQQAEPAVLAEAVRWMSTLNRAAAQAAMEVGVNAATDVTGFGLLGHLQKMMKASGTTAQVSFSHVPLMEGAWELAAVSKVSPGGTWRNRDYHDQWVSWAPGVHAEAPRMLYDPQTSGGLLFSVPAAKAPALRAALTKRGVEITALIGKVVAGSGTIEVIP